MTIGPVTFVPQGKFSLKRPYLQKLMFPTRIYPMLQGAPNFIFNELLFPQNTYFVNIDPRFLPWGLNTYTLDFLVIDAYAIVSPSPVLIPASVTITYRPPVDSTGAGISIDLFIVDPVKTDFVLPPRTVPWWLPDL